MRFKNRGGAFYGSITASIGGRFPESGLGCKQKYPLQSGAGTVFQTVAHDLNAVEEHGQAAKHGYDAENIHTYTPL